MSNTLNVVRQPLQDGDLISIGRIIRAAAEIEDLLTMLLFQVCKITESNGTLLIGQTPISAKLDKIEYALKRDDREAHKAFKDLRKGQLTGLIRMRNAIAHGVHLGYSPEREEHLFLALPQMVEPVDGETNTKSRVYHFSPAELRQRSEQAEEIANFIERNWMLAPLREKRLTPGSLRMPSAQRRNKSKK
jgi:hypothetical protein